MKTDFTLAQLADPKFSASNDILRKCVHCGFCTATCPTYTELGDERDSPRGRIYMIQQMLQSGQPAPADTVTHIDRCLSCLSCMTTCPSGVDYMHLVDHARQYVEETYDRPLVDKMLRKMLTILLPRPNLFRLALFGAGLSRPLKGLFRGRLRAMLDMAPKEIEQRSILDEVPLHKVDEPSRKGRVILMTGCAQKVLSPQINDATIRLLTRHGIEVVIPKESGCCGALPLHMGQEDPALELAKKNVLAWSAEAERGELDAIVINTSGCGTTVKDYGHLFEHDPALKEKAALVASLAKDITEYLADVELQTKGSTPSLKVAYHSACSLQHGQKVTNLPKQLLEKAGYDVYPLPEAHICCGSAGTYNLMQPEISARLKERKVKNIQKVAPDLVAAGNIGCITQIASGMELPVVHTVELLDWATGGPKPEQIERLHTA
ncbi:glycolate oxidase subunit GlcF [Sneathiella sp. P13V-1]|uniref:glycolate oxidase subunit GlcF n=1 Tax=Sneathiella sp. P13V-1 TaxID=2697366 RepID=UPI00187B28EC|nr:glycolate oxidase subunit GlcF [Sneathiella sp. P13V-1]MBE7638598.1 glycolate oxidase subunit GlcF [Sneathiella sp. P13V-1]